MQPSLCSTGSLPRPLSTFFVGYLGLGFRGPTYPRNPSSPMYGIFLDFWAQGRYYLYTWIPRARPLGPLCWIPRLLSSIFYVHPKTVVGYRRLGRSALLTGIHSFLECLQVIPCVQKFDADILNPPLNGSF